MNCKECKQKDDCELSWGIGGIWMDDGSDPEDFEPDYHQQYCPIYQQDKIVSISTLSPHQIKTEGIAY